jgi:hypothetical protein
MAGPENNYHSRNCMITTMGEEFRHIMGEIVGSTEGSRYEVIP